MDPNETLRQLRQRVRLVLDHAETIDETALELAELVQALDFWLIRGGFLPEDWHYSMRRTPSSNHP